MAVAQLKRGWCLGRVMVQPKVPPFRRQKRRDTSHVLRPKMLVGRGWCSLFRRISPGSPLPQNRSCAVERGARVCRLAVGRKAVLFTMRVRPCFAPRRGDKPRLRHCFESEELATASIIDCVTPKIFREGLDFTRESQYNFFLRRTELGRKVPVAQLDRASVYGTEGRGFESLRAQ